MGTLEDLGFTSISEMNDDEAIEHLRRIRLSRRTPTKSKKAKKTTSKPTSAKPKMSKAQAEALLKLLEEE